MDFCGALLIKIMRPVFNLPGRSALDCVASWLGDGSIGVLLTSKQYEEGFYSKREATVIATTFSAVSITFSLVVISQVGLEHMFLPFYLVVTISGIVAAIIVPKLPPLSKIPETYYMETPYCEDIPEGKTPAKYGLELALKKAEKAPCFHSALSTIESGFCFSHINVRESLVSSNATSTRKKLFGIVCHIIRLDTCDNNISSHAIQML